MNKLPEVKVAHDENGDVVTRLEYDGKKVAEVNFTTLWGRLLGRFFRPDNEKKEND